MRRPPRSARSAERSGFVRARCPIQLRRVSGSYCAARGGPAAGPHGAAHQGGARTVASPGVGRQLGRCLIRHRAPRVGGSPQTPRMKRGRWPRTDASPTPPAPSRSSTPTGCRPARVTASVDRRAGTGPRSGAARRPSGGVARTSCPSGANTRVSSASAATAPHPGSGPVTLTRSPERWTRVRSCCGSGVRTPATRRGVPLLPPSEQTDPADGARVGSQYGLRLPGGRPQSGRRGT